MLSVYYRKALRLIYQDIAERNISFENKKECRKASECISTSGKHSDTKYRQCQCREALDCYFHFIILARDNVKLAMNVVAPV